MKTKEFRQPQFRTNSQQVMKWNSTVCAQIGRKGYLVERTSYGSVEQEGRTAEYIITVWYSGNIFQRAWRKLTQW